MAQFRFGIKSLFVSVTWTCLLLGVVAVAREYPLPFGIFFGSVCLCLLAMAIMTWGRRLTPLEIAFVVAMILLLTWQLLPDVR
jgi:hypothetical protein